MMPCLPFADTHVSQSDPRSCVPHWGVGKFDCDHTDCHPALLEARRQHIKQKHRLTSTSSQAHTHKHRHTPHAHATTRTGMQHACTRPQSGTRRSENREIAAICTFMSRMLLCNLSYAYTCTLMMYSTHKAMHIHVASMHIHAPCLPYTCVCVRAWHMRVCAFVAISFTGDGVVGGVRLLLLAAIAASHVPPLG